MIRHRVLLVLCALLAPALSFAQGAVAPRLLTPFKASSGGGSSTLTAGTTATSGCTDGGFLYSLTNLLRCGANAINDGSIITLGGVAGSGENVIITNGTSTRNILCLRDNVTCVVTVADGGAITSTAVSAAGLLTGRYGILSAGYTGTANNWAARFNNQTAGTGTNAWTNAVVGVEGTVADVLPSMGVGVRGLGRGGGGGTAVGVLGGSNVGGTNRVGVWGNAFAQATIQGVGVLATLGSDPALPALPATHAALLADNGSTAADIFVARSNGSAVLTVPNGGGMQLANGSKPACASGTRGTLFYVAGGAGVADTWEVCRKDAADAYAWVAIY